MKDMSGNAVAGGQLSVYKVAEVKDGKYQYTPAFAKMDEDISAKTQSTVITESFAQSLASYAAANEVSGQTGQISSSSKIARIRLLTVLLLSSRAVFVYTFSYTFCLYFLLKNITSVFV